jgi:hypothetical protein
VLTCPWRNPDVALNQFANTASFIETTTVEMKDRFAGILETEWGSPEEFMSEFREIKAEGKASVEKEKSAANTLFILLNNINKTSVPDK